MITYAECGFHRQSSELVFLHPKLLYMFPTFIVFIYRLELWVLNCPTPLEGATCASKYRVKNNSVNFCSQNRSRTNCQANRMAFGDHNEEKTKIVEESVVEITSRTTVVSDKEVDTEKLIEGRKGTDAEKGKLERTRLPVKRLAKTQAASAAASKMKQPMRIVVEKKSKRVVVNGKKKPVDPVESGASHFDLVVDAIASYKDRNGSSRQAIAKYVASKKPNYANHLLRKALQMGVEKGKFIEMKKGFYKLSPEQKKKAKSSSKVKVSEKNKKEQKVKPKLLPKKTSAKKMPSKKKIVVKKAPTKKLVRSKAKSVQKSKKVPKHKSGKPTKRSNKNSTAGK
ncbi:unnamed protein product [Albugo candida]|uniref:H15 domain-containing protein n=1 Tax=Albugo candida TaxID=65357 RepID=A0A024G0X8_9STRA|nr:unnamed protein product [Albugo candida]|eukprot:CCI40315.1 unnamed protein product [Albugo candida]